jgi:hypothetical protein
MRNGSRFASTRNIYAPSPKALPASYEPLSACAMKYRDGQDVRVGDFVSIDQKYRGTVVGCIDTARVPITSVTCPMGIIDYWSCGHGFRRISALPGCDCVR